jgi:hypothetical protein
MKRFWKWTHYGWGWDFGPVFGWWLVWATSEHRPDRSMIYVSNDATPPDRNSTGTRGFFIRRGW